MTIEIGEFGAEELMALYVALCAEMGLSIDQMKMAALDMIEDALNADEETEALH